MNPSSQHGHFAGETGFSLGIPGFQYSDLFDTGQLARLAETFYAEIAE